MQAVSQTRPSREHRHSLPPLDAARRYPVEDALDYLATSRKSFYELVNAGLIATIKQGKRRYVPGSEIARLSQVPTERPA